MTDYSLTYFCKQCILLKLHHPFSSQSLSLPSGLGFTLFIRDLPCAVTERDERCKLCEFIGPSVTLQSVSWRLLLLICLPVNVQSVGMTCARDAFAFSQGSSTTPVSVSSPVILCDMLMQFCCVRNANGTTDDMNKHILCWNNAVRCNRLLHWHIGTIELVVGLFMCW